MSRLVLTLIAIVLILQINPSYSGAQSAGANEYHVVFGGLDDRSVEVTAKLTVNGDKLGVEYFPGRFFPGVGSWWELITVGEISAEDGLPIEIVGFSGRQATLSRVVNGSVEIDYSVDMSYIDETLPNSNTAIGRSFEDGLFIVARPLFIYGNRQLNTEVHVSKPDELEFTVPWRGGNGTYSGDNVGEFAASTVALSVEAVGARNISVGRLSYGFLLFDLTEESTAHMMGVAEDVTRYYVDTFPLTRDVKYVQLVYGTASNMGGEAFPSSSASAILESTVSGGGWGRTVFHELFHMWNSHSLNGVSTAQDLEWFKEGFTVYMTELALSRTGHMTPRQLTGLRNSHARNITTAFERNNEGVSILRSGFNKSQNSAFVYRGGWMVADWLDRRLTEKTGGEWSLERFFQMLFRDYGLDGSVLTLQSLFARVADIDEGIAADFETIITSTDWQTVRSLAGETLGLE
jgi:hypothetical protein